MGRRTAVAPSSQSDEKGSSYPCHNAGNHVRLIITLCSTAVLCAAAGADTIVLKNGDRIYADSVQEVDGRVRYTIGDNSFALPKSIVVKIETGGAPTPATAMPLPA